MATIRELTPLKPAKGTSQMAGWNIAAFSHRGRIRQQNEDAVAIAGEISTGDMDTPIGMTVRSSSCLLMIADGMGGHAHGAMASRSILDYLAAAAGRLTNPASCAQAIEEANQHLFSLMNEHTETVGMGSTVVGAILKSQQLLTFNVGDSRCYLSSRGHLVQLSHDDVQGSDRPGTGRSHALTQALGGSLLPLPIEPHITVDAPLAVGETLLLCSDGLTDMVPDHIISAFLSKATDPGMAVRNLAAYAFEAGAHDNLSLVIARPA